jgi:hypothetical protein
VSDETQTTYFQFTDQVPQQVWYWAAIGSILVSAVLKLLGKDNWSLFVGQWPPTFLILGVFHKLVRPSAR